MSNCRFYFTVLTFLNNLSCSWFHCVIYFINCFKFNKISFLSFESTCKVLASYLNHCVDRFSFNNFWSSNNFGVYNCPSSNSLAYFTWSYFLIFSSFHIRVIYHRVVKWNFFLVVVSSISLISYPNYPIFCFSLS